MENLPYDIIEKIKNDFKDEDWDLIFNEVKEIINDSIDVDYIHFLRCYITICEGNRYKFLNLRKMRYLGDPQNVFLLANNLNPKSDSGRIPFKINEIRPGWVSEYWTTDRNLTQEKIIEINFWVYNTLFSPDQYHLQPSENSYFRMVINEKLNNEREDNYLTLNRIFSILPKQEEFEKKIYKALKSEGFQTNCFWFSFTQSTTYHYDIGTVGEYEFENKEFNQVGEGKLYPLYVNLIHDDHFRNSYDYNCALGTGLIDKDFDWYILIHFINVEERNIEVIIGGNQKFVDKMINEW